MYCLNMLAIALELAREDPAYEDVASKFWEHFLYIADAMNNSAATARAVERRRRVLSTTCCTLPTARTIPLKVRSMVGLIPLFAVETLEPEVLEGCPVSTAPGVVHRASPGPDRRRRVA